MSFNNFSGKLMGWHRDENTRKMPWKNEKDPYRIWLSEIILQQTRVEQGRKYYEKFIEHYPTIFELAEASIDEVLRLWEGLGYYSRARNLHYTARYVCEEFGGEFPQTLKGLLELKGVGPYTAAAIGSFAFQLPYPVIDGNSLRVVSRYLGSSKAVDAKEGRNVVKDFLKQAISNEEAGTFNQAIMDFGATVCTPKSPQCHHCPLQYDCIAYENELVNEIPVKSKKLKRKKRYFHYLYVKSDNKLLLEKRKGRDIWKGLYQLPLKETDHKRALPKGELFELFDLPGAHEVHYYKPKKQRLTHQDITGYFYGIELENKEDYKAGYQWVEAENLSKFAFPKLVRCFLDEKQLTLNVG